MTKAKWTGSASVKNRVGQDRNPIEYVSNYLKEELKEKYPSIEVTVTNEIPLVKDRSGILHVIDPSQHKFNIKIAPESAIESGVVLLDKMLAGIKADRSALSINDDNISFTADPKKLVKRINENKSSKTSAARG